MSLHEIALEEAFTFHNGKAPKSNPEGPFAIFGSNGRIGFSKEANHAGALIIGRVGAYCGSIEYSLEPFWASDNTIVVKPRENQNLRYWYYRLKFHPLGNYAGGAAQPLLTQGTLKPIKLLVHKNEDEQEQVAKILTTYDDLIENNRRRIQLLEESARLLYQEWFVHLRFPGHEQVKIIDGVPEGWEKKPLKQIATLNYGKALKAEVRVPGPFPVYGSSGEVGSHEKALVKGPGIVVGRKGNVGSVYWVNTDFYPIDTVYFISAEESSLFLYHALQNVQFINTDVAVPGLNRDMAYSREILVPDDKNYQRFLSEALPLQEQINKLQDYSNKLAQARDLLLPKLMSGELTV